MCEKFGLGITCGCPECASAQHELEEEFGMQEPLSRHLAELVTQLSGLFATDFLGALLLSHRIGREARRETERLQALPLTDPLDIEARDNEIRHLHRYIGYGT